MLAEEPGLQRAIAKLRARDVLSEEEVSVFVAAVAEVREIAADRPVVHAG